MAKPAQQQKKVSVDVMTEIGKFTKAINEMVKQHNKLKEVNQVKWSRAKLKEKVFEACSFIARAINEDVIDVDPTRLTIAQANFDDPVNDICKEWISAISKANPQDNVDMANRLILTQAVKGNWTQRVIAKTKHGVQMVWDKLKQGIVFIYNGAKAVVKWVWNKAVQFWNWLKGAFKSVAQKLGFKGDAEHELDCGTDINVQQLIEEGEKITAANPEPVVIPETKKEEVNAPAPKAAPKANEATAKAAGDVVPA